MAILERRLGAAPLRFMARAGAAIGYAGGESGAEIRTQTRGTGMIVEPGIETLHPGKAPPNMIPAAFKAIG